jgi:hypothetical protein
LERAEPSGPIGLGEDPEAALLIASVTLAGERLEQPWGVPVPVLVVGQLVQRATQPQRCMAEVTGVTVPKMFVNVLANGIAI